jgi:CubicO group peptidase (beta-lactamase class C family)
MLILSLAGCSPDGLDDTPILREPGDFDALELAAFVDSFFEEQLEDLDIPGATFVFVRDGQVVMTRGYGLANIELEIAFDPETTVVRVGSVSKLIVATAVMQLVERGQLDLHTDVNHYLTTFGIGDEYDQPVTIANLLTHTGGFDHPPYWTTTDPSEVLPLGQYLAEQMPPRITPPGEVIDYSSHGYDLAAYIVEEISGVTFTEYVESYILQPLGMDHSSYLISPPHPDDMAVGYTIEGINQVPQPIDYDPGYPSGSFASTASDMAKLMLAYLQDGCYQEACILSADSIALMQLQQFTNHPQLPGWTYGFTEGFRNNQRMIGHGGAIRGFGSDLTLLPEYDLGYYFSFNEECYQTVACAIVSRFRSQFQDTFFPADSPALPDYESTTDLDRLTGTYRYTRYSHSEIYTWEYSYFDVEVTQSDGQLLLRGLRFVEIAPLVFQHVDGQELMAFREDDRGNIIYMFYPDTFERID